MKDEKIDKGWRGIGPVRPENKRTAAAALELLIAINDGTAITKSTGNQD